MGGCSAIRTSEELVVNFVGGIGTSDGWVHVVGLEQVRSRWLWWEWSVQLWIRLRDNTWND